MNGLPPLPRSRGPLEPKGWDRITIDDMILPGHSKVTKGGVRMRIDTGEALGFKGSQVKVHGPAVQELEIETTVWTDEQLAQLVNIARELQRLVPPSSSEVSKARGLRLADKTAADNVRTAEAGAAEADKDAQEAERDARKAQQDGASYADTLDEKARFERARANKLKAEAKAAKARANAAHSAAKRGGTPGDRPKVHRIAAPAIVHLKQIAWVVKHISPITDSTEPKGSKKVTFEFVEYSAPKPVGVTPVGNPPTRKVRNIRREVGDASANPIPSQQEFVASPTGQPKPEKEQR